MYLGYCMAPLMHFLLWISYPFAKPLALLLDYLVHHGSDPAQDEGYHRGELSALVRIQHEQDVARVKGITGRSVKLKKLSNAATPQRRLFTSSHAPNWFDVKAELLEKVRDRAELMATDPFDDESHVATIAPPLHPTEVDVIEGALQMKTKLAMDVFTPLNKVYAIPVDLKLDKSNICIIYGQGFSRVPVYQPDPEDEFNQTRVLGFLMTRQLIMVDWDDRREVSTLQLQRPVCVNPRMNLVDLLHILQSEGPMLLFVCARPDLARRALDKHISIPSEAGFMGIVTLEDIMESILQDKIYDESDSRDRDRAVGILQRWAATKLQDFYRRKKLKRQPSTTNGFTNTNQSLSEATPLLENGLYSSMV